MLASSSDELGLALDDVVLVFACSDNFVPYLSVAVQSIIENASLNRNYDVIVLTRDLSPTSMITLTRQCQVTPNVGIGFLDVDAALGDIELPHHGHFRPETYFRLLAPSLLPNVAKAVYLDSDLVVNHDVAELFDIDVTGYLVAATRDADTIGQIDGYDSTVGPYLKDELGMDDPHDYFQAGVILMNLAEIRTSIAPEEFLKVATMRNWRWLDQDVLNRLINGHYLRIPMKWNYLAVLTPHTPCGTGSKRRSRGVRRSPFKPLHRTLRRTRQPPLVVSQLRSGRAFLVLCAPFSLS